jgi:hypothetical protein
MATSVTGTGATGQVLPFAVSAVSLGTSVGAATGRAEDSIHVSPEARMLLAIAALLGDGQTPVPVETLTRLAAALGPVVISGDGTTPEITVVQRDPGFADAALARVAAALSGQPDSPLPAGATPAGYFATVRTGAGNDTILLGDPAAVVAAEAQLSGIVDSGAGDDVLRLRGHVLARPGEGRDAVELTAGSLLLSFRRNDGEDSVTLTGGTVGMLLEDVAEAELEVSRNGTDLVLRIHDTNDHITFRAYDPARGGWVRFSDGTRSIAELATPLNLSV